MVDRLVAGEDLALLVEIEDRTHQRAVGVEFVDADYLYLAVSVNGKRRIGGPKVDAEYYLHASSWRLKGKTAGAGLETRPPMKESMCDDAWWGCPVPESSAPLRPGAIYHITLLPRKSTGIRIPYALCAFPKKLPCAE